MGLHVIPERANRVEGALGANRGSRGTELPCFWIPGPVLRTVPE
jgi:hypothetical protein